jgi:hypothetical protein
MPMALRVLACLVLLAACSSREQARPASAPRKGRGIGQPMQETSAQDPAAADENLPESELFLKPREGEAQPEAADPTQAKPGEAAKRDLSDELKQSMAGATSCLKPRIGDQAPKSIMVSMTAVVTPTGGVGRSEASSSDLDAQEIACVRRQIESLRFMPPIDNAPLAVTATLQIDQAPAAPKPAAPAPAPAAPTTY